MSDIVGRNESLQIVPCNSCKHYLYDGTGACKAFDRIPKDITFGRIVHDKVLTGQKGDFVYEWDGEGLQHPEYKMVGLMRYYRQRMALGDSTDQINDELGIDPSKSPIVD